MNILVIGSVTDEKNMNSKHKVSLAANKFMINLLKGLKVNGALLQVLSVHIMPLYPRSKDIYLKKECISLTDNINGIHLSTINLPILRELHLFIKLFIYIALWSFKNKQDKDRTVILYNMKSPVPLASWWATRIAGGKVIGLIADMPFNYQFTINGKKYDYGKKGIGGYFQKWDQKKQVKSLKKMDALIVLSELTIKDFNYSKPFMVMEGGSNVEELGTVEKLEEKETMLTAMFSGSLYPIHGLDLLLDTWERLSEYKLIICGMGPDEEKLAEFCKKHPNVEYKGLVSYKELFSLQRTADLLLVPHPVNIKHVRYQFPSKLFEYMNSGTPVLTTPLEAISKEYTPYLYIAKNDTPEAFAEEIRNILALPHQDRENKGKEAREFIKQYKNWDLQTKKIMDFISDLHK